jgi:hypothetical protein
LFADNRDATYGRSSVSSQKAFQFGLGRKNREEVKQGQSRRMQHESVVDQDCVEPEQRVRKHRQKLSLLQERLH